MNEVYLLANRVLDAVDPFYESDAEDLLYGLIDYEWDNASVETERDLYEAVEGDVRKILLSQFGWDNFFSIAIKNNQMLKEFVNNCSPQKRKDVAAALQPKLSELLGTMGKDKKPLKETRKKSDRTPKEEKVFNEIFAGDEDVDWFRTKYMD